MTQVFETGDLDEASVLLREQYAAMRLRARGERRRVRIVREGLGRVSLDRLAFTMNLDLGAEPLGTLAVGRLRDGRVSYQHRDGELTFGPGEVFLAAQPDARFGARIDDLDGDYAIMDPGLLDEVASASDGPVRLLDYRPVSAQAGAHWARAFAMTRRTAEQGAHPLVVAQAERLLAAATLAAFPNTAITDPTGTDRRDAHPDTLRRARAYIEANPDLDLTVADIAAAAGVTIRAVQLAFRRHLGTTPMAHLRRTRLYQAHEELRAADPALGDTVTAIAARWGFARPSRFAALYKREFGRSPSETLRE